MLFGVPSSYFYQRDQTIIRFLPNAFLSSLMLFAFIITILNIRKIPLPIWTIIGLVLTYLFLSMLVSAYPRIFNLAIPLILTWIGYVLEKTIRINWDFLPKTSTNYL